jgi:seryl-tRNA synthetase
MLDIKFIRENKDLISTAAKKKHIDFNVDELIRVDDKRREMLVKVEGKRTLQNEVSEQIVREPSSALKLQYIEKMQALKAELQKEEEELKEVMKEWQTLMVQVPNVPDISVPDGDSDADNKEIKTWGEIPKFSFAPKNHIELMEALDMIDLDRGTKVAGFRGYFLKGDGALLNFALWNFVMDHFIAKGDFTPLMAPSLVRREPFMGTGYLPQSEEDLYKTQDADYLAGTAEVGTMGYFMGEVIPKEQLPLKFIAFSPCFRREAGSHSKDVKGLYRVHEFFKLEQVILCEASHEQSVKHHEELTANSEELLQALNIPYHIVVNCGGDLGLGQVKKYDIESWRPGQNAYGETHSSSYFHDFQTRRLNIRYKNEEGKLQFVHSLNNTALATPRILISLVENYQQEDGSIVIPQVLQKYMGGRTVISKK